MDLRFWKIFQKNQITEPNETFQSSVSQPDRDLVKILQYWLDFELFSLPEWNTDFKQSYEFNQTIYNKFLEQIRQHDKSELEKRQQDSNYKPTKKAMQILLQCHSAGYLVRNSERHPNFKIPRTYFVGIFLIGTYDFKQGKYKLEISEKEEHWNINIALLRELFRQCPSTFQTNEESIQNWIEQRIENIQETVIEKWNDLTTNLKIITFETIQKYIQQVNRYIAREVWIQEEARKLMKDYATIELTEFNKTTKKGDYVISQENLITFSWRWQLGTDDNSKLQLGPFHANTLDDLIENIKTKKYNLKTVLSHPLYDYLKGRFNEITLGKALNNYKTYKPFTHLETLPIARWPVNPKHSLCLLQHVALANAIAQTKGKPTNSIVAVNGPPGTGKTTLLKDFIADCFVKRTIELLDEVDNSFFWYKFKNEEPEPVLKSVLKYSIVVASSNNKAVENISKELPAIRSIDGGDRQINYRSIIQHFSAYASEDEWGIFCAVLGNSANRKDFNNRLSNLGNYLSNITDLYRLRYFTNSLNKWKAERTQVWLLKFFYDWQRRKETNKVLELLFQHNDLDLLIEFAQIFEQVHRNYQDHNKWSIVQNWWIKLDEDSFNRFVFQLECLVKRLEAEKLYYQIYGRKFTEAKNNFEYLLAQSQKLKKQIQSNPRRYIKNLNSDPHLILESSWQRQENELENDAEARIQNSSPWAIEELNDLRSQIFIAALKVNEALIEKSGSTIGKKIVKLSELINGSYKSNLGDESNLDLWSCLFLLFPVVSTTLASVQSQFAQMSKKETIGHILIDEAGQALNYSLVGLLQKSHQAIVVGDPLQLEPVVTEHYTIDNVIAGDFFPIQTETNEEEPQLSQIDLSPYNKYLVTRSSAQIMADRASKINGEINNCRVGIPLLVHRRCNSPMFDISNSVAYDNQMIKATTIFKYPALKSCWIDVETRVQRQGAKYYNQEEINVAFDLVKYLVENYSQMIEGGLYIITPFTKMKSLLVKNFQSLRQEHQNHWVNSKFLPKDFERECIGTVHTFQGKEASTVIFCLVANQETSGGIKWVNSKPNLINVAVSRAKNHLFVIGEARSWFNGTYSGKIFENLEIVKNIDQISTT